VKKLSIFLGLLVPIFASCDNNNSISSKNFEPIVLGDSSKIVTETNPENLKNVVNDVEYNTVTKEVATPVVAPKTDTIAQTPPPKVASEPVAEKPTSVVATSNSANNFTLNIGNNTQLVFSGISTKEFKKQDPATSNDLSYLVTAGDIQKMTISVTNGKIKTIQQRYQSTVGLIVEDNVFALKSLGTKTSDWASQKGNGAYKFTESGKLIFNTVSAQKLKDAAQKMLQQKRYKSTVINTFLNKIGSKANPNSDPFKVIAQNYQFQIEGTDSKGKAFTKIVRLDLN